MPQQRQEWPLSSRVGRMRLLGINPRPGAGLLLKPASAGAGSGFVLFHQEVGWGRAFKKKKEKGEGGSIIIFSNGS